MRVNGGAESKGVFHTVLRVSTALAMVVALGVIVTFSNLTHDSNIVHQATPTTPIQHVVVIMEENHTFDNYFGDFPGVTGTQWGVTEPPASDPLPHDLDHTGARVMAAMDGGKMDNFDPLGQVQYQQSDIPTYWAYAKQYGLGENFFTSADANSTPNHIAMIASQTGGSFDTPPVEGCKSPLNDVVLNRDESSGAESFAEPCYNINSIPQELTTAGVSWKFYGQTAVWDAPLYIQSLSSTPQVPGDADHDRCEEQPAAGRQLRRAEQRHLLRPSPGADATGAELRGRRRERDHEEPGMGLDGDLRHLG